MLCGFVGLAGASSASFPPGETVFVASTSESGTSRQRLVTARTDGTDLKPVANESVGVYALGGPRWSPDGSQIAFVQAGAFAGDGRVVVYSSSAWVVNADGGGLHEVSEGYALQPKWSPDGRWLAYEDDGDEFGTGGCCWFFVRIVRPDGSGGKKVAFGGTDGDLTDFVGEGTGWSWSPDSKHLAYVYPARLLGVEPGGLRPLAVGIVDIATMKKRYLAPGTHPAWSPDGRQLVLAMGDTSTQQPASFQSSRNPGPQGCGGLWLVPASGGKRRPLVRRIPNVCDDDPAWSPDGRWIAFTRHRGKQAVYLVVTPDGRTMARALPVPPASVKWPTDCSQLFF